MYTDVNGTPDFQIKPECMNRDMIMIKNTEKYSYKLMYSGRLQQIKIRLNYSLSRNTFRDWDSVVSMGRLFQSWIDLG